VRCLRHQPLSQRRAGAEQRGHLRRLRYLVSQCKAIDGCPTEDGTTVRASMQVAQQLGYVPEYRWAFTAIDIATWMMSVGPVVLGTDWLLSMFDPIEFKRDAWIDFKTNSGRGRALLYGLRDQSDEAMPR
jgi:hypothetical protein